MIHRLASFLLVPSFLVAACSSTTTTSGTGCDAYVNAVADFAQRCATVSPATLDALHARSAQFCANMRAAPGAATFDAQAQTCAATVQASGCETEPKCEPTGVLSDGAPCQQSFQCKSGRCPRTSTDGSNAYCGTCAAGAPEGGSCTSSGDCAQGLTCKLGANNTGTCATLKKAKQGEVCFDPTKGSSTPCDDGLRCNATGGQGATVVCTPLGKAGDACTASYDCASGLACNGKTCGQPPGEGQACTDTCASGLGCDSATKKCGKIVYVTAGATCDELHQCTRGTCEGAGVSVGSSGTPTVTPGTCVDPIPDGSACGGGTKGSCDILSDCLDGKCQMPAPAQCK